MGFDLGDTVGIGGTCRDAAGAPTNATTVVLTIQLPDGTTASPAVANPPSSVGEYGVDYVPAVAGHYEWRLVTTGPSAALTGSFDVAAAFPGLIVSLDRTKAHLRIAPTVTRYDEDLREHIAAATRAVERHLREVVVRRSVTELIQVRNPTWRLLLEATPVLALTSISRVDIATSWLLGNLDVDPDGAVVAVRGPAFCGYLRVVYTAGYASVPANIVQAAEYIVEHLWALQQQSDLSSGASPFGGFGTDSTPSGMGFAIPNRAVELLGPRPVFLA